MIGRSDESCKLHPHQKLRISYLCDVQASCLASRPAESEQPKGETKQSQHELGQCVRPIVSLLVA